MKLKDDDTLITAFISRYNNIFVSTKNGYEDAAFDYNGLSNTEALLSYDSSSEWLAWRCANYIFPNGQKGYFGSAGEHDILDSKLYEIESAISKVGGYKIISSSLWTSTQINTNEAVAYYMWSPGQGDEHERKGLNVRQKSEWTSARPFTTLKSLKVQSTVTNGKATFQIPNGTTYEVSVSDKDGYATPASQTFTAIGGTRTISMQYTIIPYINLADVEGIDFTEAEELTKSTADVKAELAESNAASESLSDVNIDEIL